MEHPEITRHCEGVEELRSYIETLSMTHPDSQRAINALKEICDSRTRCRNGFIPLSQFLTKQDVSLIRVWGKDHKGNNVYRLNDVGRVVLTVIDNDLNVILICGEYGDNTPDNLRHEFEVLEVAVRSMFTGHIPKDVLHLLDCLSVQYTPHPTRIDQEFISDHPSLWTAVRICQVITSLNREAESDHHIRSIIANQVKKAFTRNENMMPTNWCQFVVDDNVKACFTITSELHPDIYNSEFGLFFAVKAAIRHLKIPDQFDGHVFETIEDKLWLHFHGYLPEVLWQCRYINTGRFYRSYFVIAFLDNSEFGGEIINHIWKRVSNV
ncbi:hypothetical protein Dimus_036549 [Dionaea muscipula]